MSGERTTPFPTRTFWRGTTVGTLGSPARVGVGLDGWARVEPGWQLGWWIGAEDRWHLPEHEVAVRQHLVGESPVVETAMRIPGGDARQRVYAVAGVDEAGPLLVMEIENASAVPVAVAIVVTGLDDRLTVESDGPGASVHFRHVNPGGGEYRTRHRLLFDRAPADEAMGRGVATFVFPLPHTATLRMVIPLEETSVERFPPTVPAATAVAKGWEAQGGRGVRVELPDAAIAATLDATRRQLLLTELGAGELVGGLGPVGHGRAAGLDWVDVAGLMEAFDRVGFWPEAERVLLTLPDRLGDEGAVDPSGRVDTAGAALVALAHHVTVTGNDELARAMVEVAFAITLGLRRRVLPGRFRGKVARTDPLPARAPGSSDGEATWWAWWWVIAGFEAAARFFALAREDGAASQARSDADAVRGLLAALPVSGVLPASVGGAPGGTAWSNLLAGRALSAADRAGWWESTRAWLATDATDAEGRILTDPGALVRPVATLATASADLRSGDPFGLNRLSTVALDGGDQRSWPERYRVPTGAAGQGRSPDPVATAAFVSTALDLLVHAPVDGGLVLSPVVPDSWLGQGWEAHEAPTPYGRFSFAVRWHGERPALLWQLEARDGADRATPLITIPGLDPSWSTTEARGEALLGVPPAAARLEGIGFADLDPEGPDRSPDRRPEGPDRARPSAPADRPDGPIDGASFS